MDFDERLDDDDSLERFDQASFVALGIDLPGNPSKCEVLDLGIRFPEWDLDRFKH